MCLKRKKTYENQNIKRLIGFMIEDEIIKLFVVGHKGEFFLYLPLSFFVF